MEKIKVILSDGKEIFINSNDIVWVDEHQIALDLRAIGDYEGGVGLYDYDTLIRIQIFLPVIYSMAGSLFLFHHSTTNHLASTTIKQISSIAPK